MQNIFISSIANFVYLAFFLTKNIVMKIYEMNFAELQKYAIKLEAENQSLKDKQQAFQDALIEEVKRIEATPKAWRFLKYGQLLWQLIETIKRAIDKVQGKV